VVFGRKLHSTPRLSLLAASLASPSCSRQAKVNGTVLLHMIVNTDGHVSDVTVVRGLGLGLDEKAIDAVSRPGSRKRGSQLPVAIKIAHRKEQRHLMQINKTVSRKTAKLFLIAALIGGTE
jgi:hypothetical protein